MHIWAAWRGVAAVLASSSLALASCDSGGADDDRDAQPSARSTSKDHSAYLAEVLDPGTGKRTALAFDLVPGDQSTTTFEVTLDIAMAGGSVPTIPIEVVIHHEVLDAGDLDLYTTVRSTVREIDVDGAGLSPDFARSLDSQFVPAEGAVVTRQLTPSGDSMRTDYPTAQPAMMKGLQNLDSIPGLPLEVASLSFPSEPVGIGAVWSVVISKESSARPVDTIVKYTLVSLDGADYRISYEMTGDYESAAKGSLVGSGELKGALDTYGPTSLVGDATVEDDELVNGSTTRVKTRAHVEVTTD